MSGLIHAQRRIIMTEARRIHKLDLPYIWGGQAPFPVGDTPAGFDCSGFIVWLFQQTGQVSFNEDLTSDELWQRFQAFRCKTPEAICLAFYGRREKATHVGLCLDPWHMMSFTGGNHTTTTIEKARRRNAGCHIRPIRYRHDLLGFVNPFQRY